MVDVGGGGGRSGSLGVLKLEWGEVWECEGVGISYSAPSERSFFIFIF